MENLYLLSERLVNATATDQVRYLYEQIAWSNKCICLKGARGVGKTTMLRQHIKINGWTSRQALYVSLDHTWFSAHSLMELVEYHYTHGGTHLFLDEVHKYKNWIQEIKNISDFYPSLNVVFTGSSLIKIDNAIADLSRRCIVYELYGLSFREYLKFEGILDTAPIELEYLLQSHTQISIQLNSKVHLLPYFQQYIQTGYYPYYKQDSATYLERLQQVIDTVISVDIPQVEAIEYNTLYKAKKFLAILAELVPYTLNVSDLCKQLGVNRNQLLRLIDLLDKSRLIRKLYAASDGIKSLSKPEKILIGNTNIMYALSAKSDIGTIRETFFCSQLAKNHQLLMPQQGDVLIDEKYLFEIGGHKKGYKQIQGIENSFVVQDDIESGFDNKIPLWLFGMLY